MKRMIRVFSHFFATLLSAVALTLSNSPARAEILVYDHNSNNHLAKQAALSISPTAVIADATTFNTLLTSQSWSAVLVDCPDAVPTTGSGQWTPLINYVNAGGRVAMSFWDWDNSSPGNGNASLQPAFGVTTTTTFVLTTQTLTDDGTTGVFAGVTMPISNWSSNWGDDGDGFGLAGGSIGMAHLSGVTNPVMALGNSGRTIAAFVIDEAGPTWLGDGSGVQLWKNMYSQVVPEPATWTLLVAGAIGLMAIRRRGRR